MPTLAVHGRRVLGVADLRPEEDGRRSTPPIPTGTNKLLYVGPARRNGEALLLIDAVNPLKQPRRAWQYLPGQRRVKLAPDLAYDTPNPGAAGAGTYDDVSVFNGAIDRYDWKLVGKKEMYVPYSSYRLTYHKTAADITKPQPPQSGPRALGAASRVGGRGDAQGRTSATSTASACSTSTRTAGRALASDQYDARGQLYRSSFAFPSYSYDVQAPFGDTFAIYDFSSGVYNITGLFGPYKGLKYMTELPKDSVWSSEALAGSGLR